MENPWVGCTCGTMATMSSKLCFKKQFNLDSSGLKKIEMPWFLDPGLSSPTVGWRQHPWSWHILPHLNEKPPSPNHDLPQVEALLEAAQRRDSEGRCVPEHTFQACMLLANLCDLHVVTVPKSPHLEGLEGPQTSTFGYFADDIWRAEEFFVSFAACMAASAKGEPWPPTSLLEDSEIVFAKGDLLFLAERLFEKDGVLFFVVRWRCCNFWSMQQTSNPLFIKFPSRF